METFSYRLLDFEISKNFELLREKELYIWGAAEKGWQIQKTLKRFGIRIRAFCDSDIQKWGEDYENIPVISPYEFLKRYKKNAQICLISCIFRENELLRLLRELEAGDISFVSYLGIKNACIANGIVLEIQGNLPIYDKIWEYKQRNYLKGCCCGFPIKALEELETYNSNTIWNWQPGKVASRTICNRLRQAGITCIHLHTLNYPAHVLGESLREVWTKKINGKFSKKIKIITSVREPLSRDYSAFWQSFEMEHAYLMSLFNKDFQKMYEDYVALILNGYRLASEKMGCTLPSIWCDEFEWFNEEIRRYSDIDVYAYPFDKERGYQVIEKDNVQLFIFKVEKLDDIMSALCDFVGCDNLSRQDTNKAENKIYHLAYKEFKKTVRLSSGYVDHYYKNNEYVNHFYTTEEKDTFLKQWKKNIRDDNM